MFLFPLLRQERRAAVQLQVHRGAGGRLRFASTRTAISFTPHRGSHREHQPSVDGAASPRNRSDRAPKTGNLQDQVFVTHHCSALLRPSECFFGLVSLLVFPGPLLFLPLFGQIGVMEKFRARMCSKGLRFGVSGGLCRKEEPVLFRILHSSDKKLQIFGV